ncbi:MAG: hypothetical protein KBF12_06015 [Sebaldella sp.]|nr:hypothetical protein [Sebaldella sp.]
MKVLRILLLVTLLLVILAIGTLFFSGKIIESKLNTSEVQLENFKFSLKKREVTFDNFVINGSSLGPGRGRLEIKKLFGNIFDNKVYFSEMKLDNLDFNSVYAAPDKNIDKFIGKIEVPDKVYSDNKSSKNTNNLVKIEADIKEVLNFDFSTQIDELQKLKNEFSDIKSLDGKIVKLKEISEKSDKIKKDMTDKKKQINAVIDEVDMEDNQTLKIYTDELENLNQSIESSSTDNIKNITFIDKGREVLVDLNSSLKITKIIEGINESNVSIKNLDINGSKLVVKNVGPAFGNSVSAVYSDNEVKYNINENAKMQAYDISINRNNLVLTIIYSSDKIASKINYTKENLIPNINSIVINTDLDYRDGVLDITSNSSLTSEQELFIKEGIEKLEQEKLLELSKQYNINNEKIMSILDQLYTKRKDLDEQILKLKILTTSSNIIN